MFLAHSHLSKRELLQLLIPPSAPGEYQEDLKHGEGGIVGNVQECSTFITVIASYCYPAVHCRIRGLI